MEMGKRNLFAHYDMRWLKPIDKLLLAEITQHFQTIITIEDGMIDGGLGSTVSEYITSLYTASNQAIAMEEFRPPKLIRLGVNDQFVEHGSTKELYQLLKLDKEGICESLLQALEL